MSDPLFGAAALGGGMYVLARLAGWALFDPLLGRLPVYLRILVAAALAAALLPGAPAAAAPNPLSLAGAIGLLREAGLGALMALGVRIVFAAVSMALAWFGATATGGLLTLTDAQADATDASLRQLAWWLAGLAFLGANGHLLVVAALRDGLAHLPVGALPGAGSVRAMVAGAGWMFVAGSLLALPLLVAALLVQLALAVVARDDGGSGVFPLGLTLGALLTMAGLVWIAPQIGAAVEPGLRVLQSWLDGVR